MGPEIQFIICFHVKITISFENVSIQMSDFRFCHLLVMKMIAYRVATDSKIREVLWSTRFRGPNFEQKIALLKQIRGRPRRAKSFYILWFLLQVLHEKSKKYVLIDYVLGSLKLFQMR